VKRRGTAWTEIGRELGRTPQQCYGFYFGAGQGRSESGLKGNSDPLLGGPRANSQKKVAGPSASAVLAARAASTGPGSNSSISVGVGIGMSPWFSDQRKSRTWDPEEDEELQELVREHGFQWKRIGDILLRSNSQVRSYLTREHSSLIQPSFLSFSEYEQYL